MIFASYNASTTSTTNRSKKGR